MTMHVMLPGRVSKRERRMLFGGALFIGAMLTYRLGVKPLVAAMEGLEAQTLREEWLLAKERRLVADTAPQARRASQLEEIARTRRKMLYEDSVRPVTEALTFDLLDKARDSGVTVDGYESPVADTVGHLHGLTVELRGRGSLEAIADLLLAVEEGEKLYHVTTIELTPDGAYTAATHESDDGAITLRLRVRGFVQTAKPTETHGLTKTGATP